jgi:hypothetical protein
VSTVSVLCHVLLFSSPIPFCSSQGALYHKDKIVGKEFRKMELPVLASDHFGLVLTVSHRN